MYELSKCFEHGQDYILLSSSDVAEILDVSQQSASRFLGELEGEGLISRRRSGRKQRIVFTEKAVNLLRELNLNLQDFLGETEKLVLDGTLVTGIGDGAYYVQEYSDKLKEALGFNPFPGTLNILLSSKPLNLERYVVGVVEGFRKKNRSFGRIKYMPVSLSGKKWGVDCFLVLPERTHHRDEVELVSDKNLRMEYKLKDGDKVKIEIQNG